MNKGFLVFPLNNPVNETERWVLSCLSGSDNVGTSYHNICYNLQVYKRSCFPSVSLINASTCRHICHHRKYARYITTHQSSIMLCVWHSWTIPQIKWSPHLKILGHWSYRTLDLGIVFLLTRHIAQWWWEGPNFLICCTVWTSMWCLGENAYMPYVSINGFCA